MESVKGKGSTFAFTSVHEIPTKKELVGFLRSSDSQNDTVPVTEMETLSMANAPATEAPRFDMICVAEDNPYVPCREGLHLMLTGDLLVSTSDISPRTSMC